jgi:hypothetical protein
MKFNLIISNLFFAIILIEANEGYCQKNSIADTLALKCDDLEKEKLWGKNVIYYLEKQDWANYGKYYKLYFDKVLSTGRNTLHINNMSWFIVEHISDSAVLHTAMNIMLYNIHKFDKSDPYAYDTYANLLYKYGLKDDALIWEDKALKLAKNDTSLYESLLSVKKKMINNETIWK